MHTLHQRSDYPAPRSRGRFFLERGWEGDLERPLGPCGFLASVHLPQGHLLPHRPNPMDFPPAAFSTGQYLGNTFEKTAHVSQGSQERVRRPKRKLLISTYVSLVLLSTSSRLNTPKDTEWVHPTGWFLPALTISAQEEPKGMKPLLPSVPPTHLQIQFLFLLLSFCGSFFFQFYVFKL